MLVMPSYENTLLDETTKGIVEKQIEYGRKRGVPWGISESGYNLVDANLNYQYHAFGVPGTGFKRGLGEDLVIAPYATEMSLMVSPVEACRNLKLLQKEGFEGNYGFYEAIDYTQGRLPRRQNNVVDAGPIWYIIKGWVSYRLPIVCLINPCRKRFEAEVQFKATLLILQERVPRITGFYSPMVHIADAGVGSWIGYFDARDHHTAYTGSGSAVVIEWKISFHDNQCRWWLQPLERYCCYTLARRWYLRQLGNILFYTRS
jgi:cyclic beta-1,2-glucan synthetase